MTVYRIDDAARADWAVQTEPLFAEFGSKSPETAVMIDRIRELA